MAYSPSSHAARFVIYTNVTERSEVTQARRDKTSAHSRCAACDLLLTAPRELALKLTHKREHRAFIEQHTAIIQASWGSVLQCGCGSCSTHAYAYHFWSVFGKILVSAAMLTIFGQFLVRF
jgi:hypothetical protein